MGLAANISTTLMRCRKAELVEEVIELRLRNEKLEDDLLRSPVLENSRFTNVTNIENTEFDETIDEKHIRSILESSPAGITITTLSTDQRVYTNARFNALLTGDPQLSALNMNIADSFENPEGLIEIRQILKDRSYHYDSEIQRKRTDGSTWWCLHSWRPIHNLWGENAFICWHIDITKQKTAETKANEILKNSPVGISIVSHDTGDRLFTNPRFNELFSGDPNNQLIGANVTESFVKNEDLEELRRVTIEKEFFHDAEVHRKRLDGTEFWCLQSWRPTPSWGERTHMVWHYDITDRKQAEQKLSEQRAVLQNILDNVNQGIVLFDCEQKLVAYNAQYPDVLGISKSALKPGMKIWDIGYILAKKGTYGEGDPVELTNKRVETVWGSSTFGRDEIFGDERTFDVQSTLTPEGGLVVTYTDITERKRIEKTLVESKEQFNNILESSPVGVSINSIVNSERIYTNSRFNEMFGGDPEKSLVGSRFADSFVDTEIRDLLYDLLIEKDFHYDDFETHRKRIDGATFWCLQSWRPVNYWGDDAYLCWHYDITERKRTEEELLEARNELEVRVEQRTAELRQEIVERKSAEDKLRSAEKMQALGTLAGGIAHNFNNALVPIRALSELLIMQLPEDSPDRETLGEIVGGAKRAQDLVAQIMSFSRQEESKLENIDPCKLLQGSMALLHPIAPPNVKIIQRIDKDVKLVRADKAQLESIIMNMASNAFDAMEGKQGELKISLSQIELEKNGPVSNTDLEVGSYVKFQFRDTGEGMDEECMKRIFDPFFTTKEVGRGTGLGLSTVHGIMSDFGGTVEVSSELGVGTTFDIYLPLVVTDVENVNSARGD